MAYLKQKYDIREGGGESDRQAATRAQWRKKTEVSTKTDCESSISWQNVTITLISGLSFGGFAVLLSERTSDTIIREHLLVLNCYSSISWKFVERRNERWNRRPARRAVADRQLELSCSDDVQASADCSATG